MRWLLVVLLLALPRVASAQIAPGPRADEASAPPQQESRSPNTDRAILYLSGGVGGGWLDVAGRGSAGFGQATGTIWVNTGDETSSFFLSSQGFVGGASDGLLVGGRWRLELGGRLPIHDTYAVQHGLFLRPGIEARLLVVTGAVQTGAIDFPTVSAGYGFQLRNKASIEVGMRGGLTLLGAYRVEDVGSRHYEIAPTYGPFASVHLGPFHVDGIIARSAAWRSPGTPADWATGTACVTALFVGLCADATYIRTDVLRGGAWTRSDSLLVGGNAVIAFDSTGILFLK